MLIYVPYLLMLWVVLRPLWRMAEFGARRLRRRPAIWSWWWPLGPALYATLSWIGSR